MKKKLGRLPALLHLYSLQAACSWGSSQWASSSEVFNVSDHHEGQKEPCVNHGLKPSVLVEILPSLRRHDLGLNMWSNPPWGHISYCQQTRDTDPVHIEIKRGRKGCSPAVPLHPMSSPPVIPFLSLQGINSLLRSQKQQSYPQGVAGSWRGRCIRRTLKEKQRREDVDRTSLTVLLTSAAVFRIVSAVGRKYYSGLIVGTIHIMKQLLEEVEGVITHSVQPYSVKHKPFYHCLQTFQTNSLGRLIKTPL